ncbi:hypothetical protein BHE74_00020992 [Ensete ventricosum]|nr:hypothetical protein BHE74_00020992 [Ensete ventricosum]
MVKNMHRVDAVGNSPGVRRKLAEGIGSLLRVSGACQDGAREFAKRKLRLTGRLSGVAEKLVGSLTMAGSMKLQPNDGPISSLSIGLGFGRCGRFRREFTRRFVEGIGKLAGNTPGDHRGEDLKTYRKYAKAPNLGLPVVSTEAFLGLTQQVQTLAGIIQAIVPYIPQLVQALAHQCPNAPRQTLQREVPQSRPTREENPDNEVPHHLPNEVQRDFVKSKEEIGETTKGESPFVPEIQDKPIPPSFRLPILEPYDGSTDPSEHVAMFRAQMALYDTSDALTCHAFPTTLKGLARMWYNRLKSSSISSFDHLAREFELNFMASSCLRPTAASLLGLTQGSDEPLAQFVSRFMVEVRRMPDTHPSLAIQTFLMGIHPSRFF